MAFLYAQTPRHLIALPLQVKADCAVQIHIVLHTRICIMSHFSCFFLTYHTIVAQDFDAWNNGFDAWSEWADSFYTEDVSYDLRGEKLDLEGLKAATKETIDSVKKVRINNILVSEDWAAIHFYYVETDDAGSEDAYNHMQFLHFVEDGDGVRVDMCWAK